jgi:hypothetical protein
MARKKTVLAIVGIIVAIIAGSFYWSNLRGIWPIFKSVTPRESPNLKSENTTGIPLQLPAGFSISIFAQDLPGVRVAVFDHLGNLWVSQTSEGTVSMLEIKDGKVTHQNTVFKGLRNPHGLAFDPDSPSMLYIAEENKVSRAAVYSEDSLHPNTWFWSRQKVICVYRFFLQCLP